VLKAKVAGLQQRLFGRKSERALGAQLGRKAASIVEPGSATRQRRSRPQAPEESSGGGDWLGSLRATKALSALRLGVGKLRFPSQQRTDRMGSAPISTPDHSAQVSSSLRLPLPAAASGHHLGASCAGFDSQRHAGPSFLSEVLSLKFLYHVPLERIRAMVRSAGLELSAGTLCGALETLTPLFEPGNGTEATAQPTSPN
jgi:hypothetical protein